MRGYIPARVHYFHRSEEDRDRNGQVLKVRSAFPVSEVSIQKGHKVVANAKRWVTNAYWRNGRQQMREGDVPEVVVNNVPQRGFRIVSAEQRGEGGRAWKVTTPEGFLVDMREDVFLPILLSKGLPADGLIDAEFQWCQNGSQLRLEEVGSAQHALYTPADKVDEVRKAEAKQRRAEAQKVQYVPLKELVVGGVYEFETWGRKEIRIYVGRVRWKGKLRTAWLLMRYNRGLNPQYAYQKQWEENVRNQWTHEGVIMTGSKALKRLHGSVAPPVGWRDSPILYWKRSDGLALKGFQSKDLEWPETDAMPQPIVAGGTEYGGHKIRWIPWSPSSMWKGRVQAWVNLDKTYRESGATVEEVLAPLKARIDKHNRGT